MQKLIISTGAYINLMKDLDMYLIVNEPNTVNDDLILKATTYLEDYLKEKQLIDIDWNIIEQNLEKIFPEGVHIVQKVRR